MSLSFSLGKSIIYCFNVSQEKIPGTIGARRFRARVPVNSEEDPSCQVVVDQHLKLEQLHPGHRQAATTEQMLVEELN